MNNTAEEVKKELDDLADSKKERDLSRFFKTGPGQYGEGDKFIGIVVPIQRKIAKKYQNLPICEVVKLLYSPIHELRLTALFILITHFKRAQEQEQKEIFNLYLKNTKYINNWDLVDLSAPNIIGEYLLKFPENKEILYRLVNSTDLWERRIAVLATLSLIKRNEFNDALRICEYLLSDKHDLIHKATGWMLREIGKRDKEEEVKFLNKHYKVMPRVMLRYSIEKFTNDEKMLYLKK